MAEITYKRLKNEEDLNEHETHDIVTSQNHKERIMHCLCHFVLLALIILLLLRNHKGDNSSEFQIPGFQRIHSPLWGTLKYAPKVYDHANFESMGSSSPFKGLPRVELDEAWGNILNHSLILIDEDEMKALGQSTRDAKKYGDKYFAYIDVFNQLHCLDVVRKYIFREHYKDFITFQDTEDRVWYHVDHCIDILRQKIMCDSDIDVIVYTDRSKEGKQPEARFDIVHMCRNFEEIQEWTFDHAWDREGKKEF